MLEPNEGYRQATEQELNEFAEAKMLQLKENSAVVEKCAVLFQDKIDRWLKDRPEGFLEAVFKLTDSAEYKRVAAWNYTLFILKKMCDVSKEEMENGLEPVILKFTSLAEMEDVYQRTVFYLRRIEVEAPEEMCQCFWDYMNEQQLSAFFILSILWEPKAICMRYTLGAKIAEGLKKRGKNKEALLITNTLRGK